MVMLSQKAKRFFESEINQTIDDAPKVEQYHEKVSKDIQDFKKEMNLKSKKRRLLRNK
jgi:hypothetical protein